MQIKKVALRGFRSRLRGNRIHLREKGIISALKPLREKEGRTSSISGSTVGLENPGEGTVKKTQAQKRYSAYSFTKGPSTLGTGKTSREQELGRETSALWRACLGKKHRKSGGRP